MSDQKREPAGRAAAGQPGVSDLSRQDPLVLLIGKLRSKPRYWLAALALTLTGIGVLIGVSIPSSSATPAVEQGTVTWVNEGLPAAGGGQAVFLVRIDGTGKAQPFQLNDLAEWTGPGGEWAQAGGTPFIPPCLVPKVHGRLTRDGFGRVRARIKFGVVHITLPDGQPDDAVVWVECL